MRGIEIGCARLQTVVCGHTVLMVHGSGGIVEATERLYRALFTAALVYGLGTALWGLVIAPFNAFHDHAARSVGIGVALAVLGGVALRSRAGLYARLRAQPEWLVLLAILGVAALWVDGGWRSSYYLASYTGVIVAAVVAGPRWALSCAAIAAGGYVLGLAIHDYGWTRLERLRDADSVVANTGGYFIAALGFAVPVQWLGGYVARITQVLGEVEGPSLPERRRTRSLSPREVQVVQLLTDGLANESIAERLVVSGRTVQTHVANALKKTETSSRTELAVLAVREGLVPLDPTNNGGVERTRSADDSR
ncbi:MAG: hypothetical protein AVDCRST_MAG45-641 [uncultured Solirubrobacterales bacterium]|uniref:HTH luxR-type domain-containing protein n=1 Tax=uncultured Solirubrobacterales bacterium TaxID=768556 RepID=A0A6J4SAM5_9ACTN|nr:MAG: hypothetical protein AVDCRST_MAG45-641 [uncultured Solirubrobacterales bacterium]